jgi:MoaA/NifB/PqqE/SkfB family radical SAM enzyme
MPLQGLHILLTYQCNLECDHCFVWGGPTQTGVMTLADLDVVLRQAKDMGTVEWIYYEGGEPFLYYTLLLKGVRMAARMGFHVGIVSNGYWATSIPDAVECLRPFRGKVEDLSISSDLYHWTADVDRLASNAAAAAKKLSIPVAILRIAQPEVTNAASSFGQLPLGESAVMYRGRAARNLIARTGRRPWSEFTRCPHENLRDPGRVHLDPFGDVHLCQGLVLGNVHRTSLSEMFASYLPEEHPVVGPLLRGGPAELARRYGFPSSEGYADACHLCDVTRRSLRNHFPDVLGPDQMYGLPGE